MSQAALSSSRNRSTRTRDSAIQSRTAPCSASGLPKATRASACARVNSMTRSATPMTRMQRWIRPGSPDGGTCAWRRPSLGAVQAGVLQAAASPTVTAPT
jgi:hypothetical protein